MIGFRARIKLRIVGPLLVQSTEVGPWGVDAIALRDANNHLIIPGSLIRGKLRESFDDIGTDPFLRSRNEDTKVRVDYTSKQANLSSLQENLEVESHRYPLRVSDFVSLEQVGWPGQRTQTQIAIDDSSGATKTGMLRTLDLPLAPGQEMDFEGQIHFLSESPEVAEQSFEAILMGLRWISSIGSNRSVGFGRVHSVTEVSTEIDSFAASTPDNGGFDDLIDFAFDQDLCVPAGSNSDNIFETKDRIAGSAIRGAIAELLWRLNGETSARGSQRLDDVEESHPFQLLCRHFSKIGITDAIPVLKELSTDKTLPSILPLSFALTDDSIVDCAIQDGEPTGKLDFVHDWKYETFSLVEKAIGLTSPAKSLRVRTQIDSQQRIANEGNLFAYRMMSPEKHFWRTRAFWRDDSDTGMDANTIQTVLSQLLDVLSSGWIQVGKTKAFAKAVDVGRSPGMSVDKVANQTVLVDNVECFVILLRSDALMLDPSDLYKNKVPISLSVYDNLYQQFWQEVSDGLLQEIPERRFKNDVLVGGFQGWRYRFLVPPEESEHSEDVAESEMNLSRQKRQPYNPSLLTQAGSVFVLKIVGKKEEEKEKAVQKVSEWLKQGLPVPKWAEKAYGGTFQTNCYIPQNGFGEIEVRTKDSLLASPMTIESLRNELNSKREEVEPSCILGGAQECVK